MGFRYKSGTRKAALYLVLYGMGLWLPCRIRNLRQPFLMSGLEGLGLEFKGQLLINRRLKLPVVDD